MRKISNYISEFLRQQDIQRLNNKPVLNDLEHEQLRYLLTEEAAYLQAGNGVLRNEIHRLKQVIASVVN